MEETSVLYVLIGDYGQNDLGGTNPTPTHGGGGGGTFVMHANGTLLLVGGGGGGIWATSYLYAGCDASITSTSGNPSSFGSPGGIRRFLRRFLRRFQ